MVEPVIADSSYFISCARRGQDPFQELAAHAEEYEFATCSIIELEVLRGRSNPVIRDRFKERFAVMINIPTTPRLWNRACELAWHMDRRGQVIPATDLIIAAAALETDSAVLTYDLHFHLVPGLRSLQRLGKA